MNTRSTRRATLWINYRQRPRRAAAPARMLNDYESDENLEEEEEIDSSTTTNDSSDNESMSSESSNNDSNNDSDYIDRESSESDSSDNNKNTYDNASFSSETDSSDSDVSFSKSATSHSSEKSQSDTKRSTTQAKTAAQYLEEEEEKQEEIDCNHTTIHDTDNNNNNELFSSSKPTTSVTTQSGDSTSFQDRASTTASLGNQHTASRQSKRVSQSTTPVMTWKRNTKKSKTATLQQQPLANAATHQETPPTTTATDTQGRGDNRNTRAKYTTEQHAPPATAKTTKQPDIFGTHEPIGLEAKLNSMHIHGDSRDTSKHDVDTSNSKTQKAKGELSSVMSLVLRRNVASSDSEGGIRNLTFMWQHHGQGPDLDLARNLLNIFLHGSTTQGVTFPDAARMESVETYATRTLNLPVWTQAAGESWIWDCLACLKSPHYCVEGDLTKVLDNSFALDRVAQSIHVQACCANVLRQMLADQLDPEVSRQLALNDGSRHKDPVHDPQQDLLTKCPVIRGICQHQRGPKEALEQYWKVLVRTLAKLGPWVYKLEHTPPPTPAARGNLRMWAFLQEQASRLLKQLGQIVSYLVWLHQYTEGKRETMESVGRHLHSLMSLPSHPKLKLRLVLLLDPRVTPTLRPFLAEIWGVGAAFNIIFG